MSASSSLTTTDSTRTGFLQTRQWFDQDGVNLHFWLNTDEGPLRIEFDQQEVTFFVESDFIDRVRGLLSQHISHPKSDSFPKGRWYDKALPLKSFKHVPVHAIYFKEQRWLYKARDLLAQAGIEVLEGDVSPTERFLMERFITGGLRVQGDLLKDAKGCAYMRNPQIKQADYFPVYKVMSLDIETSMRGGHLYSIGLVMTHTKDPSVHVEKVFMIGPVAENQSDTLPVYLEYCADEQDLMQRFLKLYHELDPDILIGWSVINFDLRFLQRKADELGVELSLGRAEQALVWRQSRDNDQHYTVKAPGRLVLDGIDTLKSATYNFESFSLQNVSKEVLDRGKLIHDVDNRGEEITDQFYEDKPALAAYNLEDCQLVWDIFVKTKLIDFAIERAQLTGLAMDRFGGSVASFDNRYLPRLHRAGFVAPQLQENPEGIGSPGGYVMNSKPGLYQHVLVLDFKSLYPSIIRTFKIDPLALVSGLELEPNEAVRDQQQSEVKDREALVPGFNGAVFSKQQSLLPQIIEELWQARDQAKAQNNSAMSQAIKILMNSFYGVLGTPGCRFFDYRLPSSITLRGHDILTRTRALIEQEGYQVIYGDTDSIFVSLEDQADSLSSEQMHQLGHKLADNLNVWWQETLQEEFQVESALDIEFETYFSQFVMPTIRGSDKGSKKRYAGLSTDLQGKSELVFKGLETVRTDWTSIAREFQRELYRRVFYQEPWKEYVNSLVDDIRAGKHDKELVYRKRIRRRLDDYVKNIPPQIQAARIADKERKKEGKPLAYQRGGWIEYVWTINGPEPLEYLSSAPDYDLYIERQIAPIADGILQFLGSDFDSIAGQQLGMFD